MLRIGIGLLGEGKQVAEEGMMGELAKANSHLQTYISYLSVIGVCTPMIGLLGTVTGMERWPADEQNVLTLLRLG